MNNKPFVELFKASHAYAQAKLAYDVTHADYVNNNVSKEAAHAVHDDYHHHSMMLFLARERVEDTMRSRSSVCEHDFEPTHTGDMQCIHCGVSW